jgi:hypothetical protein
VQEKERGVPVEKWRRKAALALLMLLGCWRSLLKSEEEAVRALLHRAIFFPVLSRDLCFYQWGFGVYFLKLRKRRRCELF